MPGCEGDDRRTRTTDGHAQQSFAAQTQAPLDPWNKFLPVRLVQLVIKELGKKVEVAGKASCSQKRDTLQRMHHVSTAVKSGQDLPRFVCRHSNRRADCDQAYAL